MKDMPTDEKREIIKDVPDEIIKDVPEDEGIMEKNITEEVSVNGETSVNADSRNKRTTD